MPFLEKARRFLDRLIVEDIAQSEAFQTDLAVEDDKAHGGQGVSAKLPEVIVRADLRQAQNLLPRRRDSALKMAFRRDELGRLRRGADTGQRFVIELAARRGRQLVQPHPQRRHHMGWQLRSDRLAQCGRAHLAVGSSVEPDQLLLARRIGLRHHDGLPDRRVLTHRVLDLARFDAVAAQVDLVVFAPEKLDVAVRPDARHVAGAIHHRLAADEGVGDEGLGCALRLVEVAGGDADSTQAKLARHARHAGLAPAIQDVDPVVAERQADRNDVEIDPTLGVRRDGIEGRGDADFGRAVLVDEPMARVDIEPCVQVFRIDHLAAQHHAQVRRHRQWPQVEVRSRVRQQGEVRRRDVEEGDLPLAEEAEQSFHVPRAGFVENVQAGAAHQRRPVRRQGHVKGIGGDEGDPVFRRQAVVLADPVQEIEDVPMADHHALGLAGRARGVDHVGEVVRPGRIGRRIAGRAGDILRAEAAPRPGRRRSVENDQGLQMVRGFGDPIEKLLLKHQHRRTAVVEDIGDAVRRIIGIDGNVGGACLQNAELGDQHVDAAIEHQGNEAVPGDAL